MNLGAILELARSLGDGRPVVSISQTATGYYAHATAGDTELCGAPAGTADEAIEAVRGLLMGMAHETIERYGADAETLRCLLAAV